MTKKEEFLKKCMILDTEDTSDEYASAEIIESAFVIRENGDWSIFQELHAPTKGPISPKIESICYITNEMLSGCTPFIHSSDTFQSVVDAYRDGFLVAHNSFFDQKVLERHGIDFRGTPWICTWRMAKKLFNNTPEISETNLPYLRFALKLDVPIEMHCHRAGNDSYITARLLETFVDILVETGEIDATCDIGPQIVDWANAPIIYERMPFGKHKGERLKDIPTSYWQWAMKNTNWFDDSADNHDPDLAASILRALE